MRWIGHKDLYQKKKKNYEEKIETKRLIDEIAGCFDLDHHHKPSFNQTLKAKETETHQDGRFSNPQPDCEDRIKSIKNSSNMP